MSTNLSHSSSHLLTTLRPKWYSLTSPSKFYLKHNRSNMCTPSQNRTNISKKHRIIKKILGLTKIMRNPFALSTSMISHSLHPTVASASTRTLSLKSPGDHQLTTTSVSSATTRSSSTHHQATPTNIIKLKSTRSRPATLLEVRPLPKTTSTWREMKCPLSISATLLDTTTTMSCKPQTLSHCPTTQRSSGPPNKPKSLTIRTSTQGLRRLTVSAIN